MSSKYNWLEIEKDYSLGMSHGDLCRKYGISKAYLSETAKKKGWSFAADTVANTPSQFINDTARAEFEKIINNLGDKITIVDEPILIILANQYAVYLELQETVKKEGTVLYNEKGRASFINPNQNAMQSVIKNISSISKEFGLTLASRKRQKINIETEDKKDKSIFDIANSFEYDEDLEDI